MLLQPGTQIGRYEIQRRVGRGGMGAVYVAHDPVLGRLVAIKVFQTDLDFPDASQRFTREARAAAALNHTNIVTIHDFGNHESQPFIVMEYIQGDTLATVIRNRVPVTAGERLSWLEELCAGAAYAHNLGVIHRDIKPTNLIIDRTRRLKILDFGIAKLLDAVGTNATAPVGTPGYMAPEQILGEMVDQRSDVFAIGVVAYELFTGTDAFPGESLPAITYRILTQPPRPLRDVCPHLPDSLIASIERAMSKRAYDRFESAEAFRAALTAAHRDLDSSIDLDPIAPTIIRPTPAPVIRPTTGGQTAGTPAPLPVGAGTPMPDGVRTDRHRLEELRAAQLRTTIADARTALAAGELVRAQNACLQALILKADDPDAIALEAEIEAAQAALRATQLVEEAREEFERGGLTGAFDLLEQARTLAPQLTALKRLDRDLRVARAEQDRARKRTESVQQTLDASERALVNGDVEGALALARQALDLQPDSSRARDAEAAALKRLDEETGAASASRDAAIVVIADATVVVPPGREGVRDETPFPGEAPRTDVERGDRKKAGDYLEPLVATWSQLRSRVATLASLFVGLQTRVAALPTRDRVRLGIGIGVSAGLMIVGAGGTLLVPSKPKSTGTLTLDAVPWAVVTAIESTDGSHHAIPDGGSTPISLTLPAGTYLVRLSGPPPASETRIVKVVVTPDAAISLPLERFQVLTPEQYFAPYLATSRETLEAPALAGETTP